MFVKLLKWMGIIFLLLIALVVFIWVFTNNQQNKYAETAVPYINDMIPLISRWDPVEVKPYFSDAALENVTNDDLSKLFTFLSKLGELESFEEPKFTNIFRGTSTQDGSRTIVTYYILAQYENGKADITLRLLDKEGAFEIYELNYNSKALLN